ncbi:MAG TPA: hypothetical protein VGQ58_00460 [Candidatus Limnocylindrales bacterium]|jgi:hypothetical protein|nr:hypothetical protein [Candidatus Limnocylindrales bacterium]
MTDRREPPNKPLVAFVVETQMKPDGRLIHYYEWPKDQPDARPVEAEEPGMRDSDERRRV